MKAQYPVLFVLSVLLVLSLAPAQAQDHDLYFLGYGLPIEDGIYLGFGVQGGW